MLDIAAHPLAGGGPRACWTPLRCVPGTELSGTTDLVLSQAGLHGPDDVLDLQVQLQRYAVRNAFAVTAHSFA